MKFRVDDYIEESVGYAKQPNDVDAFEEQNRSSLWPSSRKEQKPDYNRSKSVDRSQYGRNKDASYQGIAFPSQMGNDNNSDQDYDGYSTNRNRNRGTSFDPKTNEEDAGAKKRKSLAHHNMFDSSQAPWGVERGNGSVP